MKLEKKLFLTLKKNRLTLAVSESCTGGELSSRLTDIPGSSQIFLLGVIAYSNRAKNKILKIPKDILTKYGAVSTEVAKLMAENIRRLSKAELGIGITGIAGPGGGTKTKPVGTVFISVSSKGKTETKKFHIRGRRLEIKRKAVDKAIGLLLTQILSPLLAFARKQGGQNLPVGL